MRRWFLVEGRDSRSLPRGGHRTARSLRLEIVLGTGGRGSERQERSFYSRDLSTESQSWSITRRGTEMLNME